MGPAPLGLAEEGAGGEPYSPPEVSLGFPGRWAAPPEPRATPGLPKPQPLASTFLNPKTHLFAQASCPGSPTELAFPDAPPRPWESTWALELQGGAGMPGKGGGSSGLGVHLVRTRKWASCLRPCKTRKQGHVPSHPGACGSWGVGPTGGGETRRA